MGNWSFILPEACTNLVLNPSGETTGNFAALAGGAITRASSQNKYGLYSYNVTTAANNDGASFTLDTAANAIHYATMVVRGTLPTSWDWSTDNVNYTSPSTILALDANWTIYGVQFPAAQATGSTTLYVRQNGAGSGDFYIDGIQVEEKSYWTTYSDGDQEGCEWNGAEHASTSDRSAQSRAGGRLYDFKDDYNFGVSKHMGTGAGPLSVGVDEYALLVGGEANEIKEHARTFTLIGTLKGSGATCDLHAARKALLLALLSNIYPKDAHSWQPVRIWYTGAEVVKEIKAYYVGGLEANLDVVNKIHEKLPLRFVCPDPNWYEIGESADGLDETDSATFRTVAARLKSAGQWNALGPPDAAGTYTDIFAVAIGSDGHVFYGGDFTNFDNDASADYIVEYDPEAGTWSPLQTGLNGKVRALAFGPDDLLYVGGDFTDAGGVAAADYVCVYDPSANTFAALDSTTAIVTAGVGGGPYVAALNFGLDGTLYIGGDFLNAGGDADADYACIWTTGNDFSAVIAGANSVVLSLATAPNGRIFIGGAFTNWGDANGDYIVEWDPDGPALSSLSTGCNAASTQAIAVDTDGIVYLGGDWTTAGGVTVNYIAKWNGTAFEAMGTGLNSGVKVIEIGPDGMIYVGGSFTADNEGGVNADRFIKWNGAAWAHLDIDMPGTPIGYAIAHGNSDPVVKSNYDIWIGFSTEGSGDLAGSVTINNPGTAHFFPRIELVCTTSGTLYSIRNETTGKELLFQYVLLAGETLTIDLEPPNRSIISSFFGPRPDATLPNSDFGSFSLQPGDNQITCFID